MARKLYEDRMFDLMFQAEAMGHKLSKFRDRVNPHTGEKCPTAKCKCGRKVIVTPRGGYTGAATLEPCL